MGDFREDIEISGSKDIGNGLNCSELFNGTSCDASVDMIEVPITDVVA